MDEQRTQHLADLIREALGNRAEECVLDDGPPRVSVRFHNGDGACLEFAGFANPFAENDSASLICLALYGSNFTLYRAGIVDSADAVAMLFAELEDEFWERRKKEIDYRFPR